MAPVSDPGAQALQLAGLEERINVEVRELARRARGRCSDGPPDVRYLFIAGCPRSGTTAITTLLNEDDRILLGQERFRLIRKLVEPFHFREEIFFNPTLRETSWAMPWRGERVFPGSFADYGVLRERWRNGGVLIVGDKAPYYSGEFSRLAAIFPGARFVLLLRDPQGVAASYRRRAANPHDQWPAENDHRRAIRDFNAALRNARAFADAEPGRLLVVDYERFFFGVPGELDRLYTFLGLAPTEVVRARHAEQIAESEQRRARQEPLSAYVVAEVEAACDRELEAWGRGVARA